MPAKTFNISSESFLGQHDHLKNKTNIFLYKTSQAFEIVTILA